MSEPSQFLLLRRPIQARFGLIGRVVLTCAIFPDWYGAGVRDDAATIALCSTASPDGAPTLGMSGDRTAILVGSASWHAILVKHTKDLERRTTLR